jgi:hypothetical protein
LIADTKTSITFFDEDKAAADDAEKPTSCEPKFLYTLDTTGLPQVSQEAIELVNAVASGMVSAEELATGGAINIPGVTVGPNQLAKFL